VRVASAVIVLVVIVGLIVYLLGVFSKPSKTIVAPGALASPPTLIAIATEIGAGSSAGNGTNTALIDLQTSKRLTPKTVRVGTFPDAIAVAPDHKVAYITNYTSNSVTPINLLTGAPERAIRAGSGPAGIAITPNGKFAYVTDAGSAPMGDTVTPINLKTGRALHTIRVGMGPQGIAITPNGKMAYVANAGAIVTGQTGAIGHTVTPINLATNKPLPVIQVGHAPVAVAVSPDGSIAFVTNSNSQSVSPISVGADVAGTPILMTGTPQAIVGIANKDEMLVADATTTGGDNLAVISVADESIVRSITVPAGPTSLAIATGGKTAWMVSSGTNALVSVNLTDGTVNHHNEISIPSGPYAIALTTIPAVDAKKLFVSPTKKKTKQKSS
jgi:YVTN family beta-propeller protein